MRVLLIVLLLAAMPAQSCIIYGDENHQLTWCGDPLPDCSMLYTRSLIEKLRRYVPSYSRLSATTLEYCNALCEVERQKQRILADMRLEKEVDDYFERCKQ